MNMKMKIKYKRALNSCNDDFDAQVKIVQRFETLNSIFSKSFKWT